MKKLLYLIIAVTGFSLSAIDAEAAKRLGGGKNMGKQRSDISQQQGAQKAAPAQQQQAAPATPAQQPSGWQRWLGPLAGLALGAGLMALFMNNGIAGALAGILMLGLLIAGAFIIWRAFRGRTAQAPLQYAGAGAGGVEPSIRPTPASAGGAGANSVAATTQSLSAAPASQWPADFNAAEFERHAKLNFVRMQDAHDRRDLATMREFLAPDLYREVETDVRMAGPEQQKTEVVTLEAQVLDVVTEGDSYVVSVRFSGLIREAPGAAPEPFTEIWHLEKALKGRSGWLVSGIQQAEGQ
jgi:predicted lipid-binding transport protein (Tim44 family)